MRQRDRCEPVRPRAPNVGGIKKCRRGHALTGSNVSIRTSRGKQYDSCRTCQRAAKVRWKRKQGSQPRDTIPSYSRDKLRVQRELLRTDLYAMPDSPYRRAMMEACSVYDQWDESDKRAVRFGRRKAA